MTVAVQREKRSLQPACHMQSNRPSGAVPRPRVLRLLAQHGSHPPRPVADLMRHQAKGSPR
jgi:hypothetical protein